MAAAGEHGRPAFAEGDGARIGQHGTIAPHAEPGRTGGFPGDGIACGDSAQRLQIVTDVERTFAMRAQSLGRRGGNDGLAARAFQIFDWWHWITIPDGAERNRMQTSVLLFRW